MIHKMDFNFARRKKITKFMLSNFKLILKNSKTNKMKKYVGVFLVALTGSLLGTGLFNHYFNESQIQHGKSSIISTNPFQNVNYTGTTSSLGDFTAAAEATVPTVVHVKTTYGRQVGNGNIDPFSFFWGAPQQQGGAQQQSTGSGVIVSEDGYIVTNNHVVENAEQVQITLDDKRTFDAKVIGTDPSTDLALLKIDAKGLNYAGYGNSDNVRVGEWALAVGNPFNLTSTVTAGIISAKARNIHILPDQKFPIESFLQTDAAVNPGNSGGALVNTKGELIGINAAIASNTGSYSGYSFAIPVNIVKKVVNDLLEFGSVQRGFIGVSIRDIDAEFAKEKDIILNGVYVNGLTEGGAAASAGLKEGDIITNINGAEIKTTPELQEQVSRYRPGDKLTVVAIRDKKERTFEVTLRNKDGNTKVIKNEVINVLGAKLEAISDDEEQMLGLKSGVKVKNLDSGKLKNAGIKEGFIITAVDNKPVNSANDVINYLDQKIGGVLIEGIYPNGMKAYYGFGI